MRCIRWGAAPRLRSRTPASSGTHRTGKTRASWNDLGAAHHEVLFKSDSGALQWNCIAPRAAALVQMDSGDSLQGWGYAEHLRLSVAPWRLPIRGLRWGRFVNATDAMVWIDWSGPYTKRVVYLNGSSMSAASVTDREVALTGEAAVLHLEDSQVIRDGPPGETALSALPKLTDLFPESVLNMQECKWVSIGAALWAQYVEGSAQLLRPYGFYGGLLGGTLGAMAAPLFHTSPWMVLAVFSVSGPSAQAFGRLRCLVQGCCHGSPAPDAVGIRYVHPRSRYAVSLRGRACGFIRLLCIPSCGTDWLDCFWFGYGPCTELFP